jgi:hypothetical protein
VTNFNAQMGNSQDLVVSLLLGELESPSRRVVTARMLTLTTDFPSHHAVMCSPDVEGLGECGGMAAQRVIFREDSVGLLMLTAFLKLEGKVYLEFLTAPIVHAVSALDSPPEVRLSLSLARETKYVYRGSSRLSTSSRCLQGSCLTPCV